MSVLLDLLLLAAFVGFVAMAWRQTPLTSALTTLSVAAALVSAFFLSFPVGSWLSDALVAPQVEQAAANDLADLVSAPHLATGRDTVATINVAKLVLDDSEAYRQIVAAYGADKGALHRLASDGGNDSAVTILQELSAPFTKALSRALAFMALFLLLWLLIRLMLRSIENNLKPPRKLSSWRRVLSLLCGALSGVGALMALTVVCEQLRVCLGGETVSLLADMFERSEIYGLLVSLTPLV